jgi:hypothetical protein
MKSKLAVTGSTLQSIGLFSKVCLVRAPTPPQNQPISFKGKVFSRASAIATNFGKITLNFTSAVTHKSDPRARKGKRNLNAHHKHDENISPFTAANTLDTINSAKSSTAVGPDGPMAIHLLKEPRPSGA